MRRLLFLLMVACLAPVAHAQYGPVDLRDAAERVLRTTLEEDATGGPTFITLNAYDVEGWNDALQRFATHPSPEIRIRAAVERGRRGEVTDALKRLPTDAERTAAARSLIIDGHIDASDASVLLAEGTLEPTLEAMLYGIDRKRSGERLEAMVNDPSIALFARGIAASHLAERGAPTALHAWHTETKALPERSQSELLFELVTVASELKNLETLEWFASITEDQPANDLLRFASTTGMLRTDPTRGLTLWTSQFNDASRETLRVPLVGVLLNLGFEVPSAALQTLAGGPPLHAKLATMLAYPPEERLANVLPLIEHGHRASIKWAVLEATQDHSAAATASLRAALNTFSKHATASDAAVAAAAARALAARSPEDVGGFLADPGRLPRELLFAALAAAGTPEAADVARPFLEDRNRATRSMALLAVAAGGPIESDQQRLLGRAAAGGGSLPAQLRAPAAWVFLAKDGTLSDAIKAIVEP